LESRCGCHPHEAAMNRSPTDHRPLPTTGRIVTYRVVVRKPCMHLLPHLSDLSDDPQIGRDNLDYPVEGWREDWLSWVAEVGWHQ
jgi:hypothetical protein